MARCWVPVGEVSTRTAHATLEGLRLLGNRETPMQLQTSATTVDFFPVGTGKRFVKRVIWHQGDVTEMTSFTTRVKSDAMYDIDQYIANGATVTDINLNEYTGDDYSPVYCW